MKIAIVRQAYTPFGGAERFVERALGALRAQLIDVSLIARSWQGDTKGLCVNPFFIGRTWRDAGFAHAVQRIIRERRFDLVQSHERIPGCHIYRAGDGVHATWLELRDAARSRLACVTTWASPWHRYTLAAESAMFRHLDLRAVICNSYMVRNDIMRRFGVASEKLHVIYNGVDLQNFHPGLREIYRENIRKKFSTGDETKVVLFVGSGFERKGLPTLMNAFACMSIADAQLWVVGRDKKQSVMERLARQLGIEQRIRFFGGQQDVRPFFGAADVFALPTLYDPFPNAVLEALASGLPTVTTSDCGAAEVISEQTGRIVPAGNAKVLTVALDELVTQVTQMRVAARSSVEHLSLDAMAARLSALYQSLIDGSQGALS